MYQDRKLAVIMFTDIVGYTSLMENDESEALYILEISLQIIHATLKQFNGCCVKEIGFVVLDSNGIPLDVVPSTTSVGNNSKLKHELPSALGCDHEVKRGQFIYWQAVIVDPNDSSKYKSANRNIAIIWKPSPKALPFKKMPKYKIPKDSALDLAYKYAIAVEPKWPGGTIEFLDPMIVIRR